MGKKISLCSALITGIVTGLLIAQCFTVLSARTGWNFGGELVALLALPMLIGTGYAMGKEHHLLCRYIKEDPSDAQGERYGK